MLSLAAWLVFALPPQVERAERDDQCIKCHEDQGAEVKGTMHQNAGVGCVSCHGTDEIEKGKHRRTATFRPARVPQIANLCGSCHRAVLEAFEPSPHFAAAKADPSDPKQRSTCSACHEYHTTSGAFAPTILERCLNCHEKASHEYVEGVAAFAALDGHAEALDRFEDHLHELSRAPGIRISDLEGMIEEGRTARRRLRISQHGLDWKRLMADAAASADRAAAAYNSLAERERRFGHRYFGLGVFLGLLGVGAALIARRARLLRKESAA